MDSSAVFALDLDGTLVLDGRMPDKETHALISKLLKVGRIIVVTARPNWAVTEFFEWLGFSVPLVAFNGAFTSTTGKPDVARVQPLSRQSARYLFEIIREFPSVLLAGFSSSGWIIERRGEMLDREERVLGVVAKLGDITSLRDGELLKVLVLGDEEATARVAREITLLEGISVTPSNPGYLEITASSASKGSGLALLLEDLGIERARVAVFSLGDSDNDVSMFEFSDFPAGIGDCSTKVRELGIPLFPEVQEGLRWCLDKAVDLAIGL